MNGMYGTDVCKVRREYDGFRAVKVPVPGLRRRWVLVIYLSVTPARCGINSVILREEGGTAADLKGAATYYIHTGSCWQPEPAGGFALTRQMLLASLISRQYLVRNQAYLPQLLQCERTRRSSSALRDARTHRVNGRQSRNSIAMPRTWTLLRGKSAARWQICGAANASKCHGGETDSPHGTRARLINRL